MAQLYAFELFASGGGGLLKDALLGHLPIGAVEIDTYARRILIRRQRDGLLPPFPIWDDVCTYRADNPETAPHVEALRAVRDRLVICGGFPCQDISAAGKGAGIDGDRSGLWGEMARIVREIRPRNVFVENSPMLTSRGLYRVLGDLAEMGYDARWGVLGADDAGAPHRRKRAWILADSKRGEPGTEPLRRAPRRVGRVFQSLAWDRDWEDALTEFRGVDDGLAHIVDRTDCTRNGQVPQVAALAWEVLSE